MRTYQAPAAFLAMLIPCAASYAQDDKAPPTPPINPVTPGTSVDGQGAPVKLDEATLQAIRQIVQESVRQQIQSQSPGPTPYATASPQGYSPAPLVAAAPVQPVLVVHQKGPFHRAMGRLGEHLARKAQPTVTEGAVRQEVVPVSYLVSQQAMPVRTTPPPVLAVPQAPTPIQYVTATPQAPRK